MKHASLFSGIGGFDLAAEWMGWENVFHCEINEFCKNILKQHFPNARTYSDIKKTDFTFWRGKVDVLTGGDPCQPHSCAGQHKGREDERYLWPEYKRAITEILPGWIVNENVRGSVSNGILDEKISDLEAIGYSWWPPFIIPACAVGANHKRERIWLVAHLDGLGMERSGERKVLEKSGIQVGQAESPFQKGERVFNTFESRLCRTLHGLPNGVHRVKALGNAVVPQVVFEIFKAIESIE